MKVFVAMFCDEDGSEIMGVFSTEELAQKEIDMVKSAGENFYSSEYIQSYTVDQSYSGVKGEFSRGGERW